MSQKAFRVSVLSALAAWALAGPAFSAGAKEDTRFRTEAVTRGDIEGVVSSTGVVNPVTVIEVGAEVSGQVAKVNADFNSRVRKGDVLAELVRTPFEDAVRQNEAGLEVAAAALDKAKVDRDEAKKKYDRALDLYAKKLVSDEDRDAAEEAYREAQDDVRIADAAWKEARASLEASRVDLAKSVIRSPIDGVVVTRTVTVGQTLAARFQVPVLFTIAGDLRTMRLQCDVDEAAVGRVEDGQRVDFTVESFPSDVFTGRVLQVQEDAEVDADVVRYPVVCEVDNTRGLLRPGMTADVTIHTGAVHGVLRVPNIALQFAPPVLTDQMKEFLTNAGRGLAAGQSPSIVWTVDGEGRLVPVVIKTGLAGQDFTEVVGGALKEGQAVVTGVAEH